MDKLVLIVILLAQYFIGQKSLKWGMAVFTFIFIVAPNDIPLFDLFTLTFVKCSIVVAFFTLMMHNRSKNLLNVSGHKKYFRPILIFSLLMLPSYMLSQFSEGQFRGLYLYFSYYFIEQFLPGVIILFAIRDEGDYMFYLKCIAWSVVAMGVFGCFEFLTDSNPMLDWIRTIRIVTSETNQLIEYTDESRYGFTRRVQSTAWHPIAYGDCLSMYVILFLTPIVKAYIDKKYVRISNKLYLVILLALINIVLTASRTPWLATAISLAIIQIYHFKNFFKRHFVFKASLTLVAIPVLYLLIEMAVSYFSTSDAHGSTVEMRLEQFDFILKSIGGALYVGFGPASIDSFYKTGNFAEALGFESIIFVFLFYYGLFGIIGLCILYYTCVKNMANPGGRSYYRSFLVAILIAHVISIILSGELRTLRVFWFLYSMLYAIKEIEIKKTIDPGKEQNIATVNAGPSMVLGG